MADGSTSPDAASVDCSSATTEVETVVCSAEALIATLSSDERDTLLYDFSDTTARTTWSNFPTSLVTRNGLRFGDLSETSRAAAMTLAQTVLSTEGYADFVGGLAADDYLGEIGGGDDYSSDNYYVAILGTPSASGDWMLQLGGHHMAYNITYVAGTGYPVPNHQGAEPKASFTFNSETYEPMSEEGAAWVAMYGALDTDQLATAYLEGQVFRDVLIGPDDGSGTLPTDYPTGTEREGVLVSSLSETQQAAVTAVIEQWVNDYHSNIADTLLSDYTSAEAYADTYVAWSGTEASGPDPDVEGTYWRVDGPRLWIEVACQGGIVVQGETHYHAIFRDKSMDYGNSL